MRSSPLVRGALLGAITSLPLMALLFLANRAADLPFVPFDLFDWLARVLPGGLITLFIDTMVGVIRGLSLGATSDVAKLIEQMLALALFLVGAAAFGAVVVLVQRRGPWPGRQIGAAGGLLLLLVTTLVELAGGWRRDEGGIEP